MCWGGWNPSSHLESGTVGSRVGAFSEHLNLKLAFKWRYQLPFKGGEVLKAFISGVPAASWRRGSTEAVVFWQSLGHLTGDNWQVTSNSH